MSQENGSKMMMNIDKADADRAVISILTVMFDPSLGILPK